MSKSPEEYFQDQTFAPAPKSDNASFSDAELAFMRKYMSLDATETLRKIGIETAPVKAAPPAAMTVSAPIAKPDAGATPVTGEASPAMALSGEKAPKPGGIPEFVLPGDGAEAKESGVVARIVQDVAAAVAQVSPEPVFSAPAVTVLSEDMPAPLSDTGAEEQQGAHAELTEAAQALAKAAGALSDAASALSEAAPTLKDIAPIAEQLTGAAGVTEQDAPLAVPAMPVTPAAEEIADAVSATPAGVVSEPAVSAVKTETETPPTQISVPEPVVPQEAMPTADSSDIATFKETVYQQFVTIKLALNSLKSNGENMALADAMYRSLTTIQNSSNYMGLAEIKVYAERTAGIVDQGRKTDTNFGSLVDLLSQECAIIEDMIKDAIEKMASAPATQAVEAVAAPTPQPAAPAPVAAEPVPQPAPAPQPAAPEPVAAAPTPVPVPQPAPAPQPVAPVSQPVAAEPVPQPAPTPVPVPQPAPKPVEAKTPMPSIRPVVAAVPDVHGEMSSEEGLEAIMRSEPELQMVGFYLGSQEFTVPTIAVQEVIRYQVPSKLPSAPEFVAGVINLRGKMTPLVYLRDMLEVSQERETEDRFIIVCRRKGLQFGLIIERVHTMYRVPQQDIDWSIESHLGMNVDLVSGLLKLNDNLVAIVSVDRIVDYVLE